jgi:TonB family protein
MTRRFALWAACPTLFALQDEPMRVGRGVSPPRLLSKVEPEYSDEARKARLNGSVTLYVVVRPTGHADGIKIIRSLGLGLDEQAILAVERWRFQPGEKEGQPVSVQATIEVNFRLLPNHGFEAGWHSKRVTFQIHDGASRPTLQLAKFPPNGDPPEEGAVSISCLVDEQGMPTALRVEKSAPRLDGEALAILRQWRFDPAMKDGKPVAVPGTIELAFGAVAAPPKPKTAAVTL